MASTREIQSKIRGIKNIKKITEAMEAVAANKMRRNQVFALKARPYALKALELLGNLSQAKSEDIELLATRETKQVGIVIFSADKGLCGAYNSNVLRTAVKHAATYTDADVSYYTVGKKASQYCAHHKLKTVGHVEDIGDNATAANVDELAEQLSEMFTEAKLDRVDLVYTNFVSTLTQKAVTRQLLPVSKKSLSKAVNDISPNQGKYSDKEEFTPNTDEVSRGEYEFEPSKQAVLSKLLPELIKIQLYHALLESNASEHSARMVAMKNASENAGELLQNLTLTYNKARQASITAEVSEIISGSEALK